MKLLELSYKPDIYLNPDGKTVAAVVDRPKIPIRIRKNHKFHPQGAPALALLDSGADRNLFPSSWASSVGIKLEKIPVSFTEGVGQKKVSIYRYPEKIRFYVGTDLGTGIQFEAEVDFCNTQVYPILGREGFFSFFKKIVFIENQKVELHFTV